MFRILLPLLIVSLCGLTGGLPQREAEARQGKRIGFTLDNQFRKEENDGNGGVVGSYGVRTGDGCLRVTSYKASKRGGFKVLSTEKRDCDPNRTIPRARPHVPRAKVISAARPTQPPRKVNARTTQPPRTTRPPRLPDQPVTSSPAKRPSAPVVASADVDEPAPVVDEVVAVKPSNIPTSTERPLPKGTTTPSGKATKNNPSKPRRNRPKQLKKEFDFEALSEGNPARPLTKKDDPVYSFGFTAPGHGHTQAGLPDGSKKGEYYFDSPDGWRRIVTYEANAKGFFPKMRRIRIPGWTSTTPAPRVSRNKSNKAGSRDAQDPNEPGKDSPDNGSAGFGGGAGGSGGSGGSGGAGGNKDGSGGTGGSGGGGGTGGSGGGGGDSGKQLLDSLRNQGVGSCPYYFFYNTKVNFHWERCMENGTKVGQYGKLHEDGFSYRTSYYADNTGYHPISTKVPLSPEQRDVVHDFTEGVFILPKTDEERRDTEQRILDWLEANRDLLADPLRA